jgi:hypothetical protein
MILRDIRTYLATHRHATLGDLALHFDVDIEAMRGMLDVWVRKGVIRPLAVDANCNKSCPTACDDTAMTIYEWTGKTPATPRTFKPLAVVGSAADSACRQRPA